MTFARVKPGDWAFGERLTSAQENQLDINASRAVDGYAGGTYTPTDPIVINGDGLQTSVVPATGNAVTNKTYVDGLIAKSHGAQFGLSGSAVTIGSKLTVTGTGPTVGSSGYTEAATNEIQVPEAGLYLISVSGVFACGDTALITLLTARVKKGATTVGDACGVRFSSGGGGGTDPALIHSTMMAQITTPASERITVENQSGGTLTALSSCWITLTRISD